MPLKDYKKFYDKFNNIYKYINNELKNNNQLSINTMLINMTPNDVLTLIEYNAPQSFYILKNSQEIRDLFIAYLYKTKQYYNNLSLPNDKLGILLSKSGAGQVQHTKEESLYNNEQDKEKYLNEILNRLIDCVNLYYDLYYKRDIKVVLGDGTKLTLKFLEKNLLHILGITHSQVKNNPELMKALNINDENIGAIGILEKIIKDIQTNKNILCLQMEKRLGSSLDNINGSKIVETQLNPDTKSELLPYDKIDLKTRAFINSGPYNDASAISNINKDSYFIKDDKEKSESEKEIQQVRISKTDFNTLEKEKVTLDTGKIEISHGDYVLNGYTKRPDNIRVIRSSQIGTSKNIIPTENRSKTNNINKFRRMFNGQSPLPVIGVENPDGETTTYFSPERQEELFLSLYYDFSGPGGMNFHNYLETLTEFAETFKNELESQAIAKTNNGIVVSNTKNHGLHI